MEVSLPLNPSAKQNDKYCDIDRESGAFPVFFMNFSLLITQKLRSSLKTLL